MTWIIQDADEDQFIKEIHSYPDRVAGIVGATIVDRRLLAAIKARWLNAENIFDELFEGAAGPLGTFSSRIKIGYAIKLYGEEAYKDLNRMRKIRNEFAHGVGAHVFNKQSIRDQANNLTLPNSYPVSTEPVTVTISENKAALWDMAVSMTKHTFLIGQLVDPRSKFLRTVEILSALLWYEEYFAKSAGVPPDSLPPTPRF
jgi:hypothetical protein